MSGNAVTQRVGASARVAYLDVCRALLMLLGIPLHATLVYAQGSNEVSAIETSIVFNGIYAAIHSFRMHAFFLISGYFAGMLLARRTPGTWINGRVVRICAPLVAGILLLNTLQMVLSVYGDAAHPPASWAEAKTQLIHLLTTPGRHWLRHLWFLVVVLEMSLLIAALHQLWPAARAWRVPHPISEFAHHHFGAVLSLLALMIGLYSVAVAGALQASGMNDHPIFSMFVLRECLLYLPYFAIGAILSRDGLLLDDFTLARWWVWAAAASAVLAAIAIELSGLGETPRKIAALIVSGFSGLLMAHVVLSGARRWLDHPWPTITLLVGGAMAIYMFHQPIIGVLGIALFRVNVNIGFEFAILCGSTLGLALLAYLGVRKNRWTNLFFNGVKSAPPASEAN